MIRSTHLASAALAALLTLSTAALAQSTQLRPAATTPPSPAATTSPTAAHQPPGPTTEQRVETYIRQLRAELRITPAEQPQWDRYIAVMRENARAMDAELAQRIQQFPTMDALQNLQSYQRLAAAHAEHLQKLVPAFESLYAAMPEQQKQLTDEVFRQHAQRRTETGGNTAR